LFSSWKFFFVVPLLLEFKGMLLLPLDATHDNENKRKVSQIIITNSVGGPNLELGSSNN
jgi:hypothetical protein